MKVFVYDDPRIREILQNVLGKRTNVTSSAVDMTSGDKVDLFVLPIDQIIKQRYDLTAIRFDYATENAKFVVLYTDERDVRLLDGHPRNSIDFAVDQHWFIEPDEDGLIPRMVQAKIWQMVASTRPADRVTRIYVSNAISTDVASLIQAHFQDKVVVSVVMQDDVKYDVFVLPKDHMGGEKYRPDNLRNRSGHQASRMVMISSEGKLGSAQSLYGAIHLIDQSMLVEHFTVRENLSITRMLQEIIDYD